MYPAKFDYVAPSSVQEAVALLEQHNGEAKILAGGHSLLPLMKLRLAQPRVLIDLGRVPGLAYVRKEGEALAIGAMATYRQIQHAQEVKQHLPILTEVTERIGDLQVRARGTLVGSLAHADPAGDMPAVMLALGALVKAVGPQGERQIALDDFFLDMLTTALGENEILSEVRVPIPGGRTGVSYHKFDQPASHYALCGVCAVVTLGNDGRIGQARIGITGVGPKAYRPTSVEEAVQGREPTHEALRDAVQSAPDGVDVQGDIHASPDYRAHLARVLTRRALVEAAERARGQS